ncbi:MAG: FtsX-like permease family protein [Verrucomicrobia bacterium]|nr:FtsX-like permease family protein [Verrucomicrobiota bacterium]
MISSQVKLPLTVALKVVLQGIRVRFGRSIVTVMGVALGVAFLMSILTGQVIKAGVSGEQDLRNETTRMYNFLVSEAGLPRGMVLGVVERGNLSPVEERLLNKILAAGPQEIRRGIFSGEGLTALLIMGPGAVRADDIRLHLKDAKHKLVCTTRKAHGVVSDTDITQVVLARELRPDEVEKAASETRKAQFRNIWIVVIALFVTVIGITNSMLMSVTERFREIGTMKCLGALSLFVRHMFLIESSLVGLVGSVAGALGGALFAMVGYSITYGTGLVFESLDPIRLLLYVMLCVGIGVILAILAALYPARFASRMLPAHALRSEI